MSIKLYVSTFTIGVVTTAVSSPFVQNDGFSLASAAVCAVGGLVAGVSAFITPGLVKVNVIVNNRPRAGFGTAMALVGALTGAYFFGQHAEAIVDQISSKGIIEGKRISASAPFIKRPSFQGLAIKA